MKVLQICAAYKPAYIYGGPTMSVSMLSEQLVKAGADTSVFTTTANGETELPVTPGVPVNVDGVTVTYFDRITKDHTHFSPALFKQLWKEAPGSDLVHIHAWWNLVSLFSCLIALLRGVTILLSPRGTLSDYSFQNKNIGLKWIIHNSIGKFLLNRCAIHVTSDREYEAVKKLIHPKNVTVIPNFVKLPQQKTFSPVIPSTIFRLIFFSRIEEKKGLDILINALTGVKVPFHLTIAGTGNEEYTGALKMLAKTNGINDKITWSGFHQEDKFALLAANDLFVLPSHDENFGNAVIESLSVGTPVLISQQVGLASYVTKNNLGWLCETNVASLSNMINEIAQDRRNDIERIRKKAPAIIETDFNESNLVKKYIALYHQLNNNDRI